MPKGIGYKLNPVKKKAKKNLLKSVKKTAGFRNNKHRGKYKLVKKKVSKA